MLVVVGNRIVSCCKKRIVRFWCKRGQLVVGENPIDTPWIKRDCQMLKETGLLDLEEKGQLVVCRKRDCQLLEKIGLLVVGENRIVIYWRKQDCQLLEKTGF